MTTKKHRRGVMGEIMSEFLIEHGWTNLPAETNAMAKGFGFSNDGYDRWESPDGELFLSLESAQEAQKRWNESRELAKLLK